MTKQCELKTAEHVRLVEDGVVIITLEKLVKWVTKEAPEKHFLKIKLNKI